MSCSTPEPLSLAYLLLDRLWEEAERIVPVKSLDLDAMREMLGIEIGAKGSVREDGCSVVVYRGLTSTYLSRIVVL